jgi:hypothetical protein
MPYPAAKQTRPIENHQCPCATPISGRYAGRSRRYQQLEAPFNLELADPDFNTPHRVEMLLGGDLYASLLKPGVLLGSGPGEPAAINTVFGWVINGPVDIRTPSVVHACLTTVDSDSLEFTLKRFWQLEEVPKKNIRKS